MATAYASGRLKPEAWKSFLNSIFREKNIDVVETIKNMKQQGFNVEER